MKKGENKLKQATQRFTVKDFLSFREGGVALATLVLIVIFTSINRNFLSLRNGSVIGELVTANAAVAAGQVMLMVVGEIDLSVGAVYSLSPYLMYLLSIRGISFGIAAPLGVLAAASVGLANGLLTVRLRVPSLLTTLGMYFFITAVNLLMSNGFYQVMPREEPYTTLLGGGTVFGVEISLIWTIITIVGLAVVLARMRHGVWSIATGSNLVGAGEVGVNTGRTKIRNFVLSSTIAGLWGIFIANRGFVSPGGTGVADPLQGGDELILGSIAAAVIGGTSLFGGSGTVIGALAGSLLIAVLKNGLTLVGATAFIYTSLLGFAIISSMVINTQTRKFARGKLGL